MQASIGEPQDDVTHPADAWPRPKSDRRSEEWRGRAPFGNGGVDGRNGTRIVRVLAESPTGAWAVTILHGTVRRVLPDGPPAADRMINNLCAGRGMDKDGV